MDMVYYELKDSLKDDACPICVLINKNVDNFIDVLLFKLLDYCGDTSIVREIMSVQLDKFKMLLNLLNEIKRRSDYRFVDEPKSNEERIAWIKAVEKCVGEPGIKK
ncbi:hypothetical protein KVG29_07730 [Caldicoprobacter algeriensis]|uniref:hypothetical protein n=1 Tax=Caldicoprobacter algeriensis TaxID=699281 RepID=UPI00207A481E|nr:hypothetical protein [Caldicoprobacter algeriensis]MCM8901116.1 hypothetical protein [Caldicoprobacter algeriensis]